MMLGVARNLEPVVQSIAIEKVRSRSRAHAWHDEFLLALEANLLRVIRDHESRNLRRIPIELDRGFARMLWDLRYRDIEGGLRDLIHAHPRVMGHVNWSLLRTKSSDRHSSYGLLSSHGMAPMIAGLIVWERMRHRMLRGSSELGQILFRRYADESRSRTT